MTDSRGEPAARRPNESALPRVVIVGGGFGGLYAAEALKRAPVEVTVVDRSNHHVFQPLLYQVATASLAPSDVAYPIRVVLSGQRNTTVILAEATAVDVPNRRVILKDGWLDYDYLIVAPGARHSYFAHPEWEEVAPGLKTMEDALAIRRRVLLAFERAERESDPERRRALLTFILVGGGPTGVELAGAIAEITCKVMAKDFRHIDPRETRTILVEAGPRILPTFSASLSAKAERSLQRLCVEVRTGVSVTGISPDAVTIGKEHVSAATILWTAGVQPSPLARSLGVPLDRVGRVIVDPDLGSGASRNIRGGRSRGVWRPRRPAAPRLGAGRCAAGPPRGAQHPPHHAGAAPRAVPLSRPRDHGRDRTVGGGRRHSWTAAVGLPGLADVVLRSRSVADRVPQSLRGAV